MKTRNTEHKVALLLNKPYFLRAKQHIVARARRLNWRLYDLAHYRHAMPDNLSPDALLTDELFDTPFLQRLWNRPFPKVRIGRFKHPKDNIYPAVVADLTTTARMIADHLAERNFKHVGLVTYDMATFHYKHLYDPLTEYAGERGLECHLLNFEPMPSIEPNERARLRESRMMEWIHDMPKPVAFVGFNESISSRVCVRCLDAGLKVPDQVAILSCGDDPTVCMCTPVQLTSVPTTGLEVADAAIDLLQGLIAGRPAPDSTVFVTPRRITTRESTDVLATSSAEVSLAARFMWNNVGKSISVDDVATAVGVSRRRLERVFREQVGRGVNAEFLRRRLEYCCKLLVSTELPIVDIVPTIGFTSTAYLHKVFRKKYEMTPQQWRRVHKQGEESF